MGYCTETEFFDRMGRSDVAKLPDQNVAASAIAAATEGIDEDCHRVFTVPTEDETRTLPVSHPTRLTIPDLVAVTSIKCDYDGDGVFETTLTADQYELDCWKPSKQGTNDDGDLTGWPYEFVTLLAGYWPTGVGRKRRVEIVGKFGWPIECPTSINMACSTLAIRLSQRMRAAPFGVQSFGELGASNIRASDPDYQMLIEPYVRKGVA